MSPAICTLLCFTALTVALAFGYVGYRVALVLTGKAAANSWTRGAATWQDPALITRLQHAHMNCVENLPVYAAVVLAAFALGQLTVVDQLAGVFLALRLGQSLIHAVSTSPAMVFIRANLYIAQMALIAYWILRLCGVI